MKLMRVLRGMAVVTMACLGMGGTLNAQTVPAERPPSSFRGDQYIDSRGCAFIRVGLAGAADWVPRVGRDRRQICGQTPSLGAAALANAPVPRTAPAAPPVMAPATAAAPAPGAAPGVQPPQTLRSIASTPRPVATAPRTVPSPGTGACAGLSPDIQQYFAGATPRCGPQAVHPGDAARGLGQQHSSAAPAATAPRQIIRYAVNPPPGYRAAWDDGRMNPYRGLGGDRGQRQMEQAWTNTVPRRLIGDDRPRGLRGVFARPSRPAVTTPVQLVVVQP